MQVRKENLYVEVSGPTEHYFHVVLLTVLEKGVQAFKIVDESLVCDHSMKAIEQWF